MKLKQHLDAKKVFVGLYVLAFAIYVVVGLQPAKAAHYEVAAELNIPSIGLTADVTELQLNNGKLDTPDTIVGSYSQGENKTLLIGHSTTVFKDLSGAKLNSTINYDNKTYRVTEIAMTQKKNVNMNRLLRSTDKDTLVIMTCAGQLLDGGDATHRLIITATR